jgi:transposase
VAQDLGISLESLRHWIKRYEVETGEREGLTATERQELQQLRRENRTLKEEREILKKAAAFFVQETTRNR